MLPFDLREFCLRCHVNDPETFQNRALRLYRLLADANRTTNLTRISSEEDYWIKHVADSLAITRYFPRLSRDKLAIADVGCGAGFPSLILAMGFDNLQLTAIDSNSKKTAFAAAAGRELGLNNFEVVTGRSRELSRQIEFSGCFDLAAARAVSDLRTLFRETRPLLRPGGQFIFYKTPEQADNELPVVMRDSRKYAIAWKRTEVFLLPGNTGKRLFVYSS
ncbi:MAG: 16S rRNA (guanine(527)-N(7))-methyltransferase RsmG [Victivallales bacterium]|nr:16S rRNA (guanine(527)-N(7))-methyltransferase RsmG [Victivallales bacterium]